MNLNNMHKLTCHTQLNKKCKDGKSRSFILYFLDDVLILKHKVPYDEDYDKGCDKITAIWDVYLYKGRIHQIRQKGPHWCGMDIIQNKEREVSFPVSVKKLKELGVNPDLKIELIDS